MKRILSKGRRSFQKKAETPRATETKAPADTYDDGIEDDSLYTDHPSIKNPYTHNGDDDDDDGGDNSHYRKVYEEVEQYYADTTNPVAKTRPSSAGKGGSGGNYPSYRSPVSTMTGTPTGTTTPAAGTTKADRAQQTRDLVKKFIADIWNRGELDLIPEVCSPSLRFNGNTGACVRAFEKLPDTLDLCVQYDFITHLFFPSFFTYNAFLTTTKSRLVRV
jgi:hypothetical protein